jgi:hypothetical protein
LPPLLLPLGLWPLLWLPLPPQPPLPLLLTLPVPLALWPLLWLPLPLGLWPPLPLLPAER